MIGASPAAPWCWPNTAAYYAGMGARRWPPPIKDLEAVFGDILPVRIRGSFWWTYGLTIVAIDLIGLENLMLYMYDNPAGLHRLMKFLHDDHLAFARWAEREGLLTLNNENDNDNDRRRKPIGSPETDPDGPVPAPTSCWPAGRVRTVAAGSDIILALKVALGLHESTGPRAADPALIPEFHSARDAIAGRAITAWRDQ